MKKILKLIIFFLVPLIANSQNVTVFDNFTKWGLPGVKVYYTNSPDTLVTNTDGIVNIDIFPNDATIIFSFMMFKKTAYTKQELNKLHNIVYLQRSVNLMQQNTSLLSTQEYSADLPFFTDIVNLDDASTMDVDDNLSANDNVTMRANEGGFSVFQGFEANKVLLSIDGIRLNDEIHRNGKVEGLLNFDNSMTQSVRKVYGTGFTIYSADAIGGVINYFTRMPAVSPDFAFHSFVEFNTKYQSASNSFINNVNLSLTSAKIVSFTSLSYGNFGNITMGKNRKGLSEADSTYGLNLYYVDHSTNNDTIISNTDPYTQLNTNYTQIYLLQKFRYKINDFSNILLNFHYVNTSEVGIYSGLTEQNFDHPRFTECEYGPQDKLIGNINYILDKKTFFFDVLSINASYIKYNEYRITRKYKNPVALHQIENISVLKFNTDFVKLKNLSRITYGLSYSYNDLTSTAFFNNIQTDSTWQGMTRYPTNGSFSSNQAVYFNIKSMGNSKLYVNFGLRVDFRHYHAEFSPESPQLPLTFTEIDKRNYAPAAGLNIDANPFGWFYLNFALAAAEHLPIIDDFGKIMVKNFTANIPTDNLKPEKNYSGKIGTSIFLSDDMKIFGSCFITYAQDAIISKDTTLNGNDSLYFGTDRYNIATKVNIPKSYIYGCSAGASYNHKFGFFKKNSIKINTSVNYIKGVDLSENLPLPNISPLFGNVNFSLKVHSFEIKFGTIFNGEKPLNELSPVGEDYIEKAASTGFLPWQIYNAKLTFNHNNSIIISAGVDNIFDKFYRPYSTAISAPGRNIVFSAKIALN